MSVEKVNMFERARKSVISSHEKAFDLCPEIAKSVISPRLIEEVLQAGLNFQFEDSSQKIKQTIRMKIRLEMRNLDSNDSAKD